MKYKIKVPGRFVEKILSLFLNSHWNGKWSLISEGSEEVDHLTVDYFIETDEKSVSAALRQIIKSAESLESLN